VLRKEKGASYPKLNRGAATQKIMPGYVIFYNGRMGERRRGGGKGLTVSFKELSRRGGKSVPA